MTPEEILKKIRQIMDFSSKDWSKEPEDWAIYEYVHGRKPKPVRSGLIVAVKKEGQP